MNFFHLIVIPSTFHFIYLPFCLLAGSSACFIDQLFHQHDILSTSHFISQPLHQHAILSTKNHQLVNSLIGQFINIFHQLCHYIYCINLPVNLLFHQLANLSTCSIIFHFIHSPFCLLSIHLANSSTCLFIKLHFSLLVVSLTCHFVNQTFH